jgi:hypothetical protein
MNRATGVLITLGAFCFSAALAWLTGDPAAAHDSGRLPRIPVVPSGRESRGFSTPTAVLANLERDLTGAGETYSTEKWDNLLVGPIAGREQYVRAFAEGWVEQNPAAALAWIESHGRSRRDAGVYTFYVSLLFDAWAKVGLESALAASAGLSRPSARAQAVFSSLQVLWKTDPARARAVFERNIALLADGERLCACIDRSRTGEEDLQFLQSLPPGKARANLLARFMEEITRSPNTSSALAFWETAPPELKQDLLTAGLTRRHSSPWYQFDDTPAKVTYPGAEELLRRRAESAGDRRELVSFICENGAAWASRDLPAAMAWTRQHIVGEAGLRYSVGLFRAAAKSDFDRTVRTWQSLPASALKAHAAGSLLRGAPANRKPEAEAFIDTLSTHHQEIARREAR